MTAPLYALRITEADHVANEFRHLGGAAWPTEAARDAALAAIPAAEDESATADRTWIVDVLDANGDIVADRIISEDTAMGLLGVSTLDDVRAQAIERDAEGRALAEKFIARLNGAAHQETPRA